MNYRASILVFASLICLNGCGGLQQQPTYPTTGVCVIGDSITAHLGPLSDWFGPAADSWVNAGVGGNTAAQVLARVGTDCAPANGHIVHVLIGINDIIISGAGSGGASEDIIPPGTAANGYTSAGGTIAQIVQEIVANGQYPIVGTVLPVTSSYSGGANVNAKVQTLDTWLKNYGAQSGIQVVDYYSVFVGSDGYGIANLYQSDNLHPNAAGNAVLTTAVGAALQ